jgi:RNA 2',3'-cyclic 3'-phosphodiesterase
MPRLFAAIALAPDARDRVSAEQRRLAGRLPPPPLRWVKPEHLHLTLVFVGEVGEDPAQRLADAMSRDIPQRPFTFEIEGVGVFPPRGAPRALWLGVGRGADAVNALQGIVVDRCEVAGVELERRSFSPHLTVARWRDRGRSTRPPELTERGVVAAVEVSVATLFESRLSSQGPTYTVLAQSPLTGE